MPNYPLTVREKTANGIEAFDIYSRLLQDRIIYLDGAVNAVSSSIIVSELLYLANQSEEDITMYIDSPGGSVTSGLSIYDAMQTIVPDVKTVGVGLCASMGAFLLSAGTKGKRFCLPSARIMVHMVSSGTEGTVVDQEISLENAKALNDYLYERMGIHCGKDAKTLKENTLRDKWMSAEEAIKFGLADKVMPFNSKKWSQTVSISKNSKKSS